MSADDDLTSVRVVEMIVIISRGAEADFIKNIFIVIKKFTSFFHLSDDQILLFLTRAMWPINDFDQHRFQIFKKLNVKFYDLFL